MDVSREGLIQRLLKEGKITQDEAYLLHRKEQKEIEYIPNPPTPNDIINPVLPIIGKNINPHQTWIEQELENRQRIAENCGCNPANGGSGICGCILTGPIIT